MGTNITHVANAQLDMDAPEIPVGINRPSGDDFWSSLLELTAAASTAAKAAVASQRNYVTDVVISNSDGATTTVSILDGATVLAKVSVLAGATVVIPLGTALRGTANTAINVQLAAIATTAVRVTLSGYTA